NLEFQTRADMISQLFKVKSKKEFQQLHKKFSKDIKKVKKKIQFDNVKAPVHKYKNFSIKNLTGMEEIFEEDKINNRYIIKSYFDEPIFFKKNKIFITGLVIKLDKGYQIQFEISKELEDLSLKLKTTRREANDQSELRLQFENPLTDYCILMQHKPLVYMKVIPIKQSQTKMKKQNNKVTNN